MGHTLDEWLAKVGQLVRDEGGVDLSSFDMEAVALRPAFARYSSDRPRIVVSEQAGEGSAYVDLPADWDVDFSILQQIEYPARQNPPTYLGQTDWTFARSASDVDVTQVLIYDSTPAASEWVRLTFSAPWPFPDATDPDVDLLGSIAFEAVASLAASFACESLASEAARDRSAALPNDLVAGSDRQAQLSAAADRYRALYERFIDPGIGAPAHKRVGTLALSRRLL